MREKGSILILVMILMMIFFVMGMTMLSIRSTQSMSVSMRKHDLMAKYVAEAGMEDARVKFQKDTRFPPRGGTGDYYFSYSESLQYPGDDVTGEYTIIIDSSANAPGSPAYDRKIIVTSTGVVRDSNGAVMARHRIRAILDTALQARSGLGSNPNLYQYIDWQDQGSL